MAAVAEGLRTRTGVEMASGFLNHPGGDQRETAELLLSAQSAFTQHP